MSENPAFFTLRQGGLAPGQSSQGQGGPVSMNCGAGLGSAPSDMAPDPHQQQYQQQRQQFPQHHLQQNPYQQPHNVGLGLLHSDTQSQWTDDHPRRVVEKCDIRDERMTEADMREALSTYVIYRLEKVPGDLAAHEDDGRAAAPTWQNVFRTEIRDMSTQAAARRVQDLGREKPLRERKAILITAQQRQIEKALEDLEAAERDPRYRFVLAQLDQQLERMSDEDYLRDERNWGRLTVRERERARYYGVGEKGGKKISVAKGRRKGKEYREKGGKGGSKKETTSITVFYKRLPRDDVDVAAMYRERTRAEPREGAAQPPWQQQSPVVSHFQPLHALQQRQGPQYPQQPQHLELPQNFQHPQTPQPPQDMLQQHPQQHHQGNFQQNPLPPPPGPQPKFPIRTKVSPAPSTEGSIPPPPPPPSSGKDKPIVVQPPEKPRKEPLREAKVIQPARRADGARGKKSHALSPRSSDSSQSDDRISCDTGTSRSSAPSESWDAKRGRSKGRERGRDRRARSESSESGRSRSRTRSRGRGRGRDRDGRDRPEMYGVRKQHVRGDRACVSPALAGDTRGVPPPPPPPSTEADALSPAALKAVFDLGKAQGQREAERNLEHVAPRVSDVGRNVFRTRDGGDWADDKVYEKPGYESGRGVDAGIYERGHQSVSNGVRGKDRAYHVVSEGPARPFERQYQAASDEGSNRPRDNDRAYHPASEGLNRPFQRRYQTLDGYSDVLRGNDRAYHPAPEGPRPFERRHQTLDEYSDGFEYTHTPAPWPRSAERRENTIRDVPRRPWMDEEL